MEIVSISEIGLVREENQDYFIADKKNRIFIIADGMGGLSNGAEASKMASNVCYEYILKRMNKTSPNKLGVLLSNSIKEAHRSIKKINSNSINKTMGTTISCVLIHQEKLHLSYIGDSRIYVLNRQKRGIFLITKDHTVAAELISKGVHPSLINVREKSTLTRSVGLFSPGIPDSREIDLHKNDVILMCTDGLSDMISDKEVEEIVVNSKSDLNLCGTKLINLAMKNGGNDNITIQLIGI